MLPNLAVLPCRCPLRHSLLPLSLPCDLFWVTSYSGTTFRAIIKYWHDLFPRSNTGIFYSFLPHLAATWSSLFSLSLFILFLSLHSLSLSLHLTRSSFPSHYSLFLSGRWTGSPDQQKSLGGAVNEDDDKAQDRFSDSGLRLKRRERSRRRR